MTLRDTAPEIVRRQTGLSEQIDRISLDPPIGVTSVVATTYRIGIYPTNPQSFYACRPVILLGPELEGGAASLTDGSASLFAYNLGTSTPPQGTQVLVTFTGSRWVFRYDV